jgi:hypothetical protein
MKFKVVHMKALVLMIIFGMNNVIGSACASSKLFHQSHHHKGAVAIEHDHENGKSHSHEHSGSHHNKETKGADECCSKSSIEFNKLDKSLSQNLEVPILEFSDFVLTSLYYNLSFQSRYDNQPLLSHIRWRLPVTIQDLRIVIQSFQI